MAWKAKYKAYECPQCGDRIGGLSVPLKRINPTGRCSTCGTKLKLLECDHSKVSTLSSGASLCRVCSQMVVWVEP